MDARSHNAADLSTTVHTFEIALNDADRALQTRLEFRVARHPSETAEYLLTRVLAYCLEYVPGLEFSKGGLSQPDSPALSIRDLTGALQCWIDIGAPEVARLHKASKAAARVVVYAHRDVAGLLKRLAGEPIHRADKLEIYSIDSALLAALVGQLARRMSFELVVSDRQLYLTVGADTFSGAVTRHTMPDG